MPSHLLLLVAAKQLHAMARPEQVADNVAIIRRAIRDRMCLSGTYAAFRVRFAPHALARDENGRQIVVAFEYGGMTLGRAQWACFEVHRLRALQPNGDRWRSSLVESRPQFDLTEIEVAVDDSWSGKPAPAVRAADD
jgi:hypothetical protein